MLSFASTFSISLIPDCHSIKESYLNNACCNDPTNPVQTFMTSRQVEVETWMGLVDSGDSQSWSDKFCADGQNLSPTTAMWMFSTFGADTNIVQGTSNIKKFFDGFMLSLRHLPNKPNIKHDILSIYDMSTHQTLVDGLVTYYRWDGALFQKNHFTATIEFDTPAGASGSCIKRYSVNLMSDLFYVAGPGGFSVPPPVVTEYWNQTKYDELHEFQSGSDTLTPTSADRITDEWMAVFGALRSASSQISMPALADGDNTTGRARVSLAFAQRYQGLDYSAMNSRQIEPPPIFNHARYGNTMTATAVIELSGVVQASGWLAAYADGDEVRGVQGVPTVPPFGPYQGVALYQIVIYGDESGDVIQLEFGGRARSLLAQQITFVPNGQMGSAVAPVVFTD